MVGFPLYRVNRGEISVSENIRNLEICPKQRQTAISFAFRYGFPDPKEQEYCYFCLQNCLKLCV